MKAKNFSIKSILAVMMSLSSSSFAQYLHAPTTVADFSHSFEVPRVCVAKPDPRDHLFSRMGCLRYQQAYTVNCTNLNIFTAETYSKCTFQNLQRINDQFVHPNGIIHQLVNATNYMIDRQAKMESEVLSQVSSTVRQQLKEQVKAEVTAEVLEMLRKEGVLK